jgi:hypothetical protein
MTMNMDLDMDLDLSKMTIDQKRELARIMILRPVSNRGSIPDGYGTTTVALNRVDAKDNFEIFADKRLKELASKY